MEELKSFKIFSRFNPEKIICEGLARDFKEFCEKNKANLEGASLEGASLIDASLEGANLRGANLRGASLGGASLEGASLEGASLRGASLEGANLIDASLEGANLRGAKLEGASLRGASLEGANLRGANLIDAKLEGANLEGGYLPIFCKWNVSFICEKAKFEDNTLDTILIKIGCKDPQTIAWWDDWFNGTETFDTPRNTLAFKLIQANYEAMKVYLSIALGK